LGRTISPLACEQIVRADGAGLRCGNGGGSAQKTVKLVRDARLKVYPGAPHGLMVTHRDQLHADLLAFLTSADPTADLRH